jgi:hypothetical protein
MVFAAYNDSGDRGDDGVEAFRDRLALEAREFTRDGQRFWRWGYCYLETGCTVTVWLVYDTSRIW